jgi:hypothetical protein
MLQWLDPDKTTLVVQLPENEYTILQTSWDLPVIQR